MITAERLALEAERLRRVPGIYFGEESDGRRAKVAGTGIDVWEVINGWQWFGGDFDEFCREMDWLTPTQLRAALNYYDLYPEEINRFLAENEEAFELIEKFSPVTVPYPEGFKTGAAE